MGLYSGSPIDIKAISESMSKVVEQWFNASIKLVVPNIAQGTYDKWANKVTGQAPTTLWTGPARIQPLRWPMLTSGQAEQAAFRAIRIQFARDANITPAMLVREGLRIRVTNGGEFPDLERGLFVVTSGLNSSYAWNRTVEAQTDTGVDLGLYEEPVVPDPDPEPEPDVP